MAYECVVKSNYFHVKDPNAFRKLISEFRMEGQKTGFFLYEKMNRNDEKVFAFGSLGGMDGRIMDFEHDDENPDNEAENRFFTGLQECVAENDAIILFGIGHDGLRNLVAVATVITSNDMTAFNLEDQVLQAAGIDILQNPDWSTMIE